MRIEQALGFKTAAKKLHKNQKKDLDRAIEKISDEPDLGQIKKGDLSRVRVYKFRMKSALTLLAYVWEEDIETITLLKLGSHENFYRDLKN